MLLDAIIRNTNFSRTNVVDLQKEFESLKDKFSELFFYGSVSVVGIDIGLSAVKVCELVKTQSTFKVNKFVSIPLPEGVIIEDEIQKEDELIAALQKAIKDLNPSSKFACFGVSGPNAIIKKIQLAGGTPEEIEDQVMWEIEQYLPFSAEEGNISFHVVGENRGGGVDVIVGAAKKTVIASFKSVIEATGLKVKVIDLTAAAILNVFEHIYLEKLQDDKSYIVLDLGAQTTQLIIYKGKVLSFYKEISIGGVTITEEIQRQMGVSYEEAEELKINGDGSGNIPEEIITIINQVLETLFAELKKTLEFYTASSVDESFEFCVLTGGGTLIDGISEAIEELIGCPVEVLNPFSLMSYNQSKIDEEDLNTIIYSGVAALGLGMREYQK